MKLLQNFLLIIINLLIPNTCISCRSLTSISHRGSFCIPCFNNLNTFIINKQPDLINIIKESDIDSFNCKYLYKGSIIDTILAFKFNDQPQLGKHLANLMNPLLNSVSKNSLIVPVPVHKKRLLKRKYNQTSILSKYLAKDHQLEYSNNALKRVINTPHQTGQNAKTRKKQLKDAFIASESIVKGKDIILIDDVFTTGTTVKLCATELKQKGAKTVNVITIAYTPK